MAGEVQPSRVDTTGDNLTISEYEVPGWTLAQHAVFKNDPAAWKFGLEASSCDISTLGPSVRLESRKGMAAFYSIEGGPLSGMVVKAFVDPSSCLVHIGTKQYASASGW